MPQRGASAIEVDVQNVTKPAHAGATGAAVGEAAWFAIAGVTSEIFITKTTVFATGAIVMAGYSGYHSCEDGTAKMQFFMDGVQMAESAYIVDDLITPSHVSFVDNKVMSGSSIVRVDAHNYNVAAKDFIFFSRKDGTTRQDGSLIIGAVK